ncbi:MAG: hypothetical protein LRY71_16590 [Bacillaceae bacterium]|nr:hypothetical protein [Bacillaceae bacterium]
MVRRYKSIEGDFLYSISDSSNGWTVVIKTDKEELMGGINRVVNYVYLTVSIFVILSIIVGLIVTLSVTKPINKIVHLMT